MITPYEVEFGHRIGFGGLFVCCKAHLFLCVIISLSFSL
jgi:hypothetical protein